MLATIFAALHPRCVRNLAALTVPLEMSAAATLLPSWLTAQTVEVIIGLYGNCPAWVFGALSAVRLMTRMERYRAEICGLEDREIRYMLGVVGFISAGLEPLSFDAPVIPRTKIRKMGRTLQRASLVFFAPRAARWQACSLRSISRLSSPWS